MKDDFAEAVEMLAKSVADEVHTEAGAPCGYYAKVCENKRQVEFTFRVGLCDPFKYSFPVEGIDDLKSSTISWQPIFEKIVRFVLKETSPLGYAQRIARQKDTSTPPEIPVYVDQQGRRHLTLKAETGILDRVFGNVNMTKGETKQ